MATKAKTKANRAAERKSNRSLASPRNKENPASLAQRGGTLAAGSSASRRTVRPVRSAKGDKRKGEVAQKICLALEMHAQIEEEIFYPQAREATKDDDLIDESLVEHATVKNLIREIEEMEVGDDLYDAKIRVLGEMVKHHIHEEEQELFPEIRAAKIDLAALGNELADRKQILISSEMQA